jgi:ABC-type uncharacterized transport system ATPase subunit
VNEPLLSLRRISKSFGRVRALDGVDFDFHPGTITCILGENGAGKSTLMRVAAGVVGADSGIIEVSGTSVTDWSSRAAAEARVAIVHQHFLLVHEFTVEDNLALFRRDLPFFALPSRRRLFAADGMRRSGVALPDGRRRVRDLAVGERAKVEIAKALALEPRVLILDEPTAVLTPPEVDELAALVRQQAARGVSVVIVTHKLADVFAMSDSIVVMREGKVVRQAATSRVTPDELAEAMVGSRPFRRDTSRAGDGPIVAEIRRARTATASRGSQLDGSSLTLRAGEIVALAGVSGNGQNALAEVLRGLLPVSGGEIVFDGEVMSARRLRQNRRIAHIPADRTEDGIFHDLTIAENLAVGSSRRQVALERRAAERAIAEFSIRAGSPDQKAGTLSGGNQQKVLLARELARGPALLIASEPTRGLDPESTAVVRRKIREAADRGAAVLLMTSDLDEARELGDTFQVIYRGRTVSMPAGAGNEEIGRAMAGLA